MAKKMLVVDDQHSLRAMVAELLFEEYAVEDTVLHSVGQEYDAILLTRHHNYDLVVTDLEMENADSGIRIAKAVKAKTPNAKVILMSGNTRMLAELQASNLGDIVDFFIAKPFQIDVLLGAVYQLIGNPLS